MVDNNNILKNNILEAQKYIGAVCCASAKSHRVGRIVVGVLASVIHTDSIILLTLGGGGNYTIYGERAQPHPYWYGLGFVTEKMAEIYLSDTERFYFMGCPLRTKFLKEQNETV